MRQNTEDRVTYRVALVPRTWKVQAVCSCGWRSSPTNNGGMAGALFDIHKEEAHS